MNLTYKLKSISVTDFKKIKHVDLDLSNTLTIIGGKNANGKSSLIDALVSAVGGVKHAPKVPVRTGSRSAEILLTIESPSGDLMVKRVFRADGAPMVEITNAEGFKTSSPQKLLDSWFNATAIDPLSFIRLEGKKQVELIKKIFGIDFTEIDARRKLLYEKRSGQNAVWQALEKTYQQMEREGASEPKDTPNEEISAESLLSELKSITAHNDQGVLWKGDAERAADRLTQADEWIENTQNQIAEIEKQLASAKATLESQNAKRGEIEKSALVAQKVFAGFEPMDPAPIEEQLQAANRINGFVRQKQKREEHRLRFTSARQEADALTDQLREIDAQKARILSGVQMPVEGLTFDEEGLYLNGLPIEQASSAEQLRVSIPVSFASDSSLKFAIIRDGSLLDEESLRIVAELTEAAGGQTIIERVTSHAEECSVILEDGEIAKAVA
jgi:predicted ATP-dependent endonuclease of OLD family